MKGKKKMTSHLINFYDKLAKELQSEQKMSMHDVLAPIVPSKQLNPSQFADTDSAANELQIDLVNSQNIVWSPQKGKSVLQSYQNYLQKINPDVLNGQEDFQEIKQTFKALKQNLMKVKVDMHGFQNLHKKSEVDREQIELQGLDFECKKEEAQEEINNFVKQNYVSLAKENYQMIQSMTNDGQIKQENLEQFEIYPLNWLDMIYSDKDNSHFFKKVSYISNSEKIKKQAVSKQQEQNQETFYNLLKGFGIGELENNKQLEIPLDSCFENLQIEAECISISYERKWMEPCLLSNDSTSQQLAPKLKELLRNVPKVSTGALILKNICIRGFKNTKLIQFMFKCLRENSENAYGLQFKIQNDFEGFNQNFEISQNDDDLFIKIGSPQILAYILSPLDRIQERLDLNIFNQIKPQNIQKYDPILNLSSEQPLEEFFEDQQQTRILKLTIIISDEEFKIYLIQFKGKPKQEIIEYFQQEERNEPFCNQENWLEKLNQFIDEMESQVDDGLKDILPSFQNFSQKQYLINKLNVLGFISKKLLKLLLSQYLGLSQEFINAYSDYYQKYKLMTNRIENIFEEEKEECIRLFKDISKNEQNIESIKNKTLIHPQILKILYDSRLDPYLQRQEFMHLIKKIAKNKNNLEIAQMLYDESKEIKTDYIKSFKFSINEYNLIKEYCLSNQFCLFLLQSNEIEDFYSFVQNGQNAKLQNYLQKIQISDPIFCMKLLYNLSNSLSESGEIQIQESVDYLTFNIYQNKNIVRVISKAYLISQQEDQEQAFLNQKEFEERKLFKNDENEKVEQFINQFLEFKKKQNEVEALMKAAKYQKMDEIQESDLKHVKQYIHEFQQYKNLIQGLKKEFDPKFDNSNEQNNIDDIQKLSDIFKKQIYLRQNKESENICFGEKKFGLKNNIELIIFDDRINEAFYIQRKIVLKIQNEVQNPKKFRQSYPEIFNLLSPYMKNFFGYQNLFKFIYNENQDQYMQERIDFLNDISKQQEQCESDATQYNFIEMQILILNFQNADQNLFNEWFNQFKNSSKQILNFLESYELQKARNDIAQMVEFQRKIKVYFPDPLKTYTLKEFNRMVGRIDKNVQFQNLKDYVKIPNEFVEYIILQMFGYFNRRENLSSFLSDISSLNLPIHISSRFLLSLVLQNSDINLRARILQYQSEYFSVPMIMQCQRSYEGERCILRYVPEISFIMREGLGVLNIGAGGKCVQQCGKSQLINDLLFPSEEISHEAFEQADKNLFSVSHVDVFFEKSFEIKRNFVLMDGQSKLKKEAFESSLLLTNLIIINFNKHDLNEPSHFQDLKDKIEFIHSMKDQKICILLLIRDSIDKGILKREQSEKISTKYEILEEIEQKIDCCIEIKNMSSMTKGDRINEMKDIYQYFYLKIEYLKNNSYFRFTRQNYLENFMKHNEADKIIKTDQKEVNVNQIDQLNLQIIKDVNKKVDIFMKEFDKIKDDIFQDDGLKILDIKRQIRQKILDKRRCISQIEEEQIQVSEKDIDKEIEDLRNQLKNREPSKILWEFQKIVLDENHQLLQIEIAKRIKELSFQQVSIPKQRHEDLIQNQKNNLNATNETQREEVQKRMNEYKKELIQINIDIQKQTYSIEYFWRCLIFYLGNETDIDQWHLEDTLNKKEKKIQITKSIDNQLKNGDCFELIDGENLEFKGLFIKEVIENSKQDKVIVVCVIGPQSSGKSTLMNSALGTQFSTGTGRCTVGIYFTLQQFPEEINGVKWLLLLDTEGLQSPERIDDEYDRKIVLFAMLSADVLIINNKGEINAKMINTLKMCCITFDMMQQVQQFPEIIYIFGQNDVKDKEPFKVQVQDLQKQVIDASVESKTIEETAEKILGYNEKKINVLGVAYKNEAIEKDDQKGLKFDNKFKLCITNFGVESSKIFQIIIDHVKNNVKNFQEISFWLDDARRNWDLIDKYTQFISRYKDLDEYKNNKKVKNFFLQKWADFQQNGKQQNHDQQQCDEYKKKLTKVLNSGGDGEFKYNLELKKVINEFNILKDKEMDNLIMRPFDQWKQSNDNKAVTLISEKKYKAEIRAKFQALKSEFEVKINDKMKIEIIKFIQKNGHKKIQDRAMDIVKEYNFKQMQDEQKREKYILSEFNKKWDEALREIGNQNEIEKMKKSYFDSLYQTFSSFNEFITFIGDDGYDQILKEIEGQYKNQKDSMCLVQYLQNILKLENKKHINLDKEILKQMNKKDQKLNKDEIEQKLIKEQEVETYKKIFKFNTEMLFQMREDPQIRLYSELQKETFLHLKKLIYCKYTYRVRPQQQSYKNSQKIDNADLKNQIHINQLKKDMLLNLSQKKYVEEEFFKYNFYGKLEKFKKKELQNDVEHYQKYLRDLFQDFKKAGFKKIFNNQLNAIVQGDQVDQLIQSKSNQQNLINDFVNNMYQDPNLCHSAEIHPRIFNYFIFKVVEIKNRSDPNETFQQHKQMSQDLKDGLLICKPEIEYYARKKDVDKPEITQKDEDNNKLINYLIKPRSNDEQITNKHENLAQIAYQNLDWKQIATHIIKSVQIILKSNYDTLKSSQILKDQIAQEQDDLDLDQIMEVYQMSYSQIEILENEHLNTKLKEVIGNELLQKMGLLFDHESKARISFCAMLVCWVEIYKKAERASSKHIQHFLNQKQSQLNMFRQIVNEQNDLITEENSKKIFKESIDTFLKSLKDKYQKNILEQIQKQEKDFETLLFYQRQDSFYFDFEEKHTITIKQFIRYVEDPVGVFEERAYQQIQKQIDPIIEDQSIEMIKQIQNNLDVLRQVLFQIKQKIDSINDEYWIRTKLENYFNIYDQKGNQLDFKEKKDITSQFSPIIYQCVGKILDGKFNTQNSLQIDNQTSQYKDFKFIPVGKLMNGPLQFFEIENDSIIRITSDPLTNQLVKQIVEYFNFNSKKDKLDCPIFQIDVTIKQFLAACEEKIEEYDTKIFNYNEKWFECKEIISNLQVRAVGCKSKCMFCGRKCELSTIGHGAKHSCNTVGHQMRVFKGGHFQGKTGKIFPSLWTCDMIDPNTTIFIDGIKNNWRTILNTQLAEWNVNYKNKDKNKDSQMMNAFDKFWLHVGEEYCKINKFNFIKKMEEMEENQQIHESGIIVIALDKSTSMGGSKWKNANKGTQSLIQYLRKHHSDEKKMHICIIHFNHDAECVHEGQLDQEIPEEIFKREVGGGTYYGPVYELAFKKIREMIKDKEAAKFYFFTDGTAPFPTESYKKIEEDMKEDMKQDKEIKKWKSINGRNKLDILLMCEMKEEVREDGSVCVMKRMRDQFNLISKAHFGEIDNTLLHYQVATDKIGELMIQNFETFIFNQDQK